MRAVSVIGRAPAFGGAWAPAGRAGHWPALPAALVLAGAVAVQSGAGIAARMFDQLPPAAVTTLRLWSAALIMVIVAGRGTVRVLAGLAAQRGWRDAVSALSFCIALGFMNFAIYQAFARIPLGIAVTIEFLGPLSVTVAGTLRGGPGRTAGLGCAALASAGVVLLAGTAGGARLNWAGVDWAAAAGAAWAAYILGSKAAGQQLPGASGLVIAMCAAAVAVTGPGLAAGAPAMFSPALLGLGACIGLLSSVIPYWLELEALRRIPTSLFGVWMSLQPAVAALIGLALLSQRLSVPDWGGVGCVVAAAAGAAAAAQAGPPSVPAVPAGASALSAQGADAVTQPRTER
jgi:inner membrane transporter RhtA